MPTAEEIRAILKENVYDPEIMINIVDLGLIYDIRVDEEQKAITIDMTLTSPGCPIGPLLIRDVQQSVQRAFPELKDVQVNLVWSPLWNPEMMSEEAKDQLGFF